MASPGQASSDAYGSGFECLTYSYQEHILGRVHGGLSVLSDRARILAR